MSKLQFHHCLRAKATIVGTPIGKSACRLSHVINCQSILQYASTLKSAQELDFLKKMLLELSLTASCRKADLRQCIDYINVLADDLSRPYHLHNHQCQQFYGPMYDSHFSDSVNRKPHRAA